MNKIEFEQVQAQYRTSGKSLKNFLKEIRVSYTTYNYWRKKLDAGKRDHPMVPITIREPQGSNAENQLDFVSVFIVFILQKVAYIADILYL